jgi:hypothetical protein
MQKEGIRSEEEARQSGSTEEGGSRGKRQRAPKTISSEAATALSNLHDVLKDVEQEERKKDDEERSQAKKQGSSSKLSMKRWHTGYSQQTT